MARERYLIGVDPEELKPQPSPPPAPQTPAKRLENLWYHYKWHIIVSAFVVVVLLIGIVQMVSKDDPDYTVELLTRQRLSTETVAALEEQLAAVGTDRDGDGKVEVLIENLAQGIPYSDIKVANDNTLLAHLAAGDVLLYAMEPEYYESRIKKLAGNNAFFATLSDGTDHAVWQPSLDGAPEELWVGVRGAAGTASDNDAFDNCLALVEKLAAK